MQVHVVSVPLHLFSSCLSITPPPTDSFFLISVTKYTFSYCPVFTGLLDQYYILKTGQLSARQKEPRFPIVATVRCCLTGLGLWQFIEQEEQKNLRGARVFVPRVGIKMAAAHVKNIQASAALNCSTLTAPTMKKKRREDARVHATLSLSRPWTGSRAADCCRTLVFQPNSGC